MRHRTHLTPVLAGLLAIGTWTLWSGATTIAGAATKSPSCNSITKSVVIADGFSAATTPKITPYNYTKTSANAANALGTTIDFGSRAIVLCPSLWRASVIS